MSQPVAGSSKNIYSPLAPWLKKQGFKIETGGGLHFTHTSLAGGVYDITKLDKFLEADSKTGQVIRTIDQLSAAEIHAQQKKQSEEFLRRYALSIANIRFRKKEFFNGREKAKYNFLSEKTTDNFKLFIDLDFATWNSEPLDGYSSAIELDRRIEKLQFRKDTYKTLNTKRTLKLETFKKAKDALDHEKLLLLIRFIQDGIKQFYPGLSKKQPYAFTCLICLTIPKHLKKENDEGLGEGVHLIFPYLIVNSNQALDIRQTLLEKIKKHELFWDRPEHSNWDKVYDEGVYGPKGGALRMLGSRKAEKCKECSKVKKIKERERKEAAKHAEKENAKVARNPNYKAKPYEPKSAGVAGVSKSCPLCNDQGHVWNSRVYWPEYMLASDGSLMVDDLKKLLDPDVLVQPDDASKPPMQDNLYRLMKLASLRTMADAPNPMYKFPADGVHWVPIRVTGGRKRRQDEANAGYEDNREHHEDYETMKNIHNKHLFARDHPWLEFFLLLVIQKFGKRYENCSIGKCYLIKSPTTGKKSNDHPTMLINITGPGSNWCPNYNDNHNHNTVYFILTQYGLSQRCHCKCKTNRPSGIFCSEYVSEVKSLTDCPLFLNQIFPQMFHGVPWSVKTDRRWGSMPEGFTDVLWNRITRSNLFLEDVNTDGEMKITQNDSDLTSEMATKIELEIRGSSEKPKPRELAENPEEQEPHYEPTWSIRRKEDE